MRFDTGTKTRVIADMTLDIDPTGSTVEVQVDSDWYDAEWLDEAATANGKWTQSARTIGYFAGPDVDANELDGAATLATGRHMTQTRVTKGGDILVANSSPIDVVT